MADNDAIYGGTGDELRGGDGNDDIDVADGDYDDCGADNRDSVKFDRGDKVVNCEDRDSATTVQYYEATTSSTEKT